MDMVMLEKTLRVIRLCNNKTFDVSDFFLGCLRKPYNAKVVLFSLSESQ